MTKQQSNQKTCFWQRIHHHTCVVTADNSIAWKNRPRSWLCA